MLNLTDLLHNQKTIEQESRKYRRLMEQRFELLQLLEELRFKPDEEDVKFIESLNQSIINIERRIAVANRNLVLHWRTKNK